MFESNLNCVWVITFMYWCEGDISANNRTYRGFVSFKRCENERRLRIHSGIIYTK